MIRNVKTTLERAKKTDEISIDEVLQLSQIIEENAKENPRESFFDALVLAYRYGASVGREKGKKEYRGYLKKRGLLKEIRSPQRKQ